MSFIYWHCTKVVKVGYSQLNRLSSIFSCLSMIANGRSQFLLDCLGRGLKLFVSTESTYCHEFASHFGLNIFLYVKNTLNYREYRVARPTVYLNEATRRKGGVNSITVGRHRTATTWRWRVRMWVCVRDVLAIYDNNIWPRLIMIIIQIIIRTIFHTNHTHWWFPLNR